MKPLRVLIVEDSLSFQKLLTYIFDSTDEIQVVGTAVDPYEARDKIKLLNPDVLTLDINMPRMDGATFLANLMRLRPMPVVMISSLTERNAAMALRVLEIGAVDYIGKPQTATAAERNQYADEVIRKVKAAGKVSVQSLTQRRDNKLDSYANTSSTSGAAANSTPNTNSEPASAGSTVRSRVPIAAASRAQVSSREAGSASVYENARRIIAVGSSTGGTVAVGTVLEHLPTTTAGIVIAQHIPEAFSASFADRLDKTSKLTVVEAEDGQLIKNGHVYIAPGSRHLKVKKDGLYYKCVLEDSPPVNKHRPSVDVLFNSVAENVGKHSLGIILTGMGRDGADGLQVMKEAGAETVAQDEKSSVVWGMPGEAVKLGCVDDVLPLHDIAEKIIDYTERQNR